MLTVKLSGHRKSRTREETGGALRILRPCRVFFRLLGVRFLQFEKKSSLGTYLEWLLRMTMWSALLAYAVERALCVFSLLTNIKNETTVLSSDGIHSVVGYATSVMLLGGFLSIRRRAEVNDFLRRMDKYTTATRDPQVSYKSSSVSFLYALLSVLVLHSACLSYTTSVLDYKIVERVSTVVPLPTDNATSDKSAAPSPTKTSKTIYSDNFLGGRFDKPEDADDLENSNDVTENQSASSIQPVDVDSAADGGEGHGDVGEVDDELHQERRRRRRSASVAGGLPVREIIVDAEQISENDANELYDTDQGSVDYNVPESGRKILFRSRRGLIDSAIDEDIDGDGVNFIELFKPFRLAVMTTRYLIIKNIIYLSVTMISCFCKIIRGRLLEVNTRMLDKQTPELTVDVLADVRQKHTQCLSLLREVEQNFSFFCLLWNVLTFLEIVYMGRMIYEIHATTLYELPKDQRWIWGHSAVLCVDIILLTVFHLNFINSAASARLEALRTVDLVTIGTANIPPSRIEAHQQAELLVSVATIRDPGLSVWDILPQTRVFGYFVLLLAYIVLYAHIQFLRDGKWRDVFGQVLQKKRVKGSNRLSIMVSAMKTDSSLVKTCAFLLRIFSIGITWPPKETAHGTKLLIAVYRVSLWTTILFYALSRVVYFLSLLSYSGFIRFITLDGLDDAAFILCCLVLLTQSYRGLQLNDRLDVLAFAGGTGRRRRRPLKSYVATSLFSGCLLFLLGSSSVLVVLRPVLDEALPEPAPKFITTTEAPTTTKRSNIAAGGGGPPSGGMGPKAGVGGDFDGNAGGGDGGLRTAFGKGLGGQGGLFGIGSGNDAGGSSIIGADGKITYHYDSDLKGKEEKNFGGFPFGEDGNLKGGTGKPRSPATGDGMASLKGLFDEEAGGPSRKLGGFGVFSGNGNSVKVGGLSSGIRKKRSPGAGEELLAPQRFAAGMQDVSYGAGAGIPRINRGIAAGSEDIEEGHLILGVGSEISLGTGVAFSAATCWTVREQLRRLKRAFDLSTTDQELPSAEVLAEMRHRFLQSTILCRFIDLHFRRLSPVWILIVFIDVQLLLNWIHEVPPSLESLPMPPATLIMIHLAAFSLLHIFFTEGAENLRREFGSTLQLVATRT
ncbi:uncharacterized protein LOC114828180 [Galendromus occidentalis]|uniref:Uncharacterized protein LOC114828180 n=1 Tax=Galendromus occidentalis TaxID=34638 RepID=A0AAJ7SEH8_9ACAR|nr:uncharacterized protein LOC114828180 [Galendromus occidentalis]